MESERWMGNKREILGVRISCLCVLFFFFFFQAEDGIRDSDMWLEFRRVLFRSSMVYFNILFGLRSMLNAKVLSRWCDRSNEILRFQMEKAVLTISFCSLLLADSKWQCTSDDSSAQTRSVWARVLVSRWGESDRGTECIHSCSRLKVSQTYLVSFV